MESVFEIIAEPNRRAILSLLIASEQSVGEIERQLGMPQPTVSKHLRVLRDAGLVQQAILDSDARARLIKLRQPAFTQLRAWLDEVEAFWGDQLAAFKAHAERGRKRARR